MKRRVLATIALGIALTMMAGDALVCSVCKRSISGKYLKGTNGKMFCGQTCADRTLQRCTACSRPIKKGFYKHRDKPYCSQRCLQTAMPKCIMCTVPMKEWNVIVEKKFCGKCSTLPRCADCMLPSAEGKTYKDQRVVCKGCLKTVIVNEKDVMELFLAARGELKKMTGMQTDKMPGLELASNDEIVRMAEKQMGEKPKGLVRGFYQRTEHFKRKNDSVPSRVEKKIYVLYGMRKETYAVTAIHELTHDLIAEKFPRLKESPAWVQEGLCQYNAYTVAKKYKLESHASIILNHPDKAYGDGFRFFLKAMGPGNWKKMSQWMSTVDASTIPKNPPKPKGVAKKN